MNRIRILLAVTPVLIAAVCVADWPQYLGSNRNAISDQKEIARSWPEDGPKVLWSFPLGVGYAGPAISAGKVYILDRDGDKQDILRCIDLASGKEEWTFPYDAPGRTGRPGSRSVPTVEGNYVYTCGPFGDVHCIDTRSREAVWKKNIWRDFGGQKPPRWGIAQNPLNHGELLILASQTPKAGVVAYDKKTGDVHWTSKPFEGRPGYVSPVMTKIGGEDQIVAISAGQSRGHPGAGRRGRNRSGRDRGGRNGPDRDQRRTRPPEPDNPSDGKPAKDTVVGLDPKTGAKLWSYNGWQCQTPVPGVTAIGDGRIFITGGYKAGSAMIKISRAGDGWSAKELYKTQDFGTHVHPAIHYKEHLYGHCTTNTGRADGMVCMDLDGNVKWKTGRSPIFDKGGFILVGDLMLSMDGARGILYLIKPDPEGFNKLASAKLLDTNECWAPLALSDDKLLIRDQKHMKCVVVK